MDRFAFGHGFKHARGNARHEADFSDVEETVHDGGDKVFGGDGLRGGFAAVTRGLADHLTHFQAAAVEEERRKIAPVIAAAILVDRRGAAHLAAADQ